MRNSTVFSTGLLMCVVLLTASCSGADPAAEPPVPAAEMSNSSDTPTSELPTATRGRGPEGTGRSALEQHVVDAMAAAGVIDPDVDEDGFTTATVSGAWDSNRAWTHAYQTPEGQTPGEVLRPVTVGGVPAEVVRTDVFGEVLTFQCGDLGYQVTVLRGDGRAASGVADDAVPLAEALIAYLRCGR